MELPHVTRILKVAGLIDDRFFTEEARDRGSALHMATHFLEDGDLDWETVDGAIICRLRSYQNFLDEVKPTMLFVEHRVCNEALNYCGTVDRVLIIGEHRGVLDIKPPSQCAWHGIQLALYAGCLPAASTLKRWTLHLSDDRYQLIEHKDRKDWEVAKAAITLAAWKVKHEE